MRRQKTPQACPLPPASGRRGVAAPSGPPCRACPSPRSRRTSAPTSLLAAPPPSLRGTRTHGRTLQPHSPSQQKTPSLKPRTIPYLSHTGSHEKTPCKKEGNLSPPARPILFPLITSLQVKHPAHSVIRSIPRVISAALQVAAGGERGYPGHVKRLVLENFMCHEHIAVDFM